MFADPITITVGGAAKTLARISSTGLSSVYQTADELFKLTISHQVMNNGRIKSMARLDQRAVVTNPLDSSTDWDTLSEWKVIERPAYGFSSTNVTDLNTGFDAWITTTVVGKLLGKES